MTGILEIPSDQYHQDAIAETPSLSASVAHTLVAQSPKHAWAQHPRLNRQYQRVEEAKFDVGTVAHAILLEGRDCVQVVDAADWRTNAAKEQRDEARAAGRVPLLVHQMGDVEAMVLAVREQLEQHDLADTLLVGGQAEQTIVWDEDGVVCRSRLDWLSDDRAIVADLKTTSRSAHHKAFERNLFSTGCDVQCAFYLRGLMAVTGAMTYADFVWVVVETAYPHALSVIQPSSATIELGTRKVGHAIKTWRECLAAGVWPAYSTSVEYAEPPEWELSRWLEREAIKEAA